MFFCVWCIANHWEDIVCLFKNFSQNNHVVTGRMKSTLILFLVLTGLPLCILWNIMLTDMHQRLTDVRETGGAFRLHFFSCHRMRNSGSVLFLLGRCTKAHILLHAGLSLELSTSWFLFPSHSRKRGAVYLLPGGPLCTAFCIGGEGVS